MLSLIKAVETEFQVNGDLKLLAILLGLQNQASTRPCILCTVEKHELHSCGEDRTVEGITNHAAAFQATKNASGKDFHNCIHKPLIGSPGDRVFDLVLPPSLHLLLGITTNILKALEKEAGKEFVDEFIAESSGILRTAYHGGCLNGNSCRQFIRSGDALQAKALAKGKMFEVQPFVTLVCRFDDVIKGCFGHELYSNYKERIDSFLETYVEMSLPVTPKVHYLWHHIVPFCEKTGLGLALFSEQTLEASHHAFGSIWNNRYKKDHTSSSYGASLLACVIEFNSKRSF